MDDKKLEEIKRIQQEKVEELNREMGLGPADFSKLTNIEGLNDLKSIGPDANFENLTDISGLRKLSSLEEEIKRGKRTK